MLVIEKAVGWSTYNAITYIDHTFTHIHEQLAKYVSTFCMHDFHIDLKVPTVLFTMYGKHLHRYTFIE